MPIGQKLARFIGRHVLFKGAWILPVSKPEPVVIGPAAEEEDDAEDDETEDGDELDTGEPELGFSEEGDGDYVEQQDDEEDHGDPDSDVDGGIPVVEHNRGSTSLGGDQHGICVPVVPASGKRQTGVYETVYEVGDGDTLHGQVGDHLSEVVHDTPDDTHHGEVGHEEGRGARVGEDTARAHEETGSNGTTCEMSVFVQMRSEKGNWRARREGKRHTQSEELDVTTLEAALELILAMGEVVFGIGGENGAQLRLLGAGATIFALEVRHVGCEEVEEGREEEGEAGAGEEYSIALAARLARRLVTRIIMG